MAIQRLPGDVAAQVQSSVAITSLNAVVLGLLRNALDAGATRVSVTVDYSRGACVVDDDGVGIAPVEFSADGGLAKSCYTSKFPPSSALHGRHGTFLAAVANLALLTIVSQCETHDTAHALTIHNGHVLRRHAPADLDRSADVSPTPHGTHVAVHDLFGCMPVRARQRPTESEASSVVAATARDWEELVRSATALLLAWPRDVAVFLSDEKNAGHDAQRRRRRLGRPRDPGGMDSQTAARLRTTQLLAQAGLCSGINDDAWVRVSASTETIAISGFVCLVPAASRQAQFLRIGVQPLSEEHHADGLYDEINRIFAESDFGVDPDTIPASRSRSRSPAGVGPMDRFVRVRKSPKTVDRWPLFSIGINFSASDPVAVDDVLDDRRQHLSVLKRLLRAMLEQFLGERGFYGRRSLRASPAKKQGTGDRQGRPRRNEPFLSWPRTKYAEPPGTKPRAAAPAVPLLLPRKEQTSRFFGACSGDDASVPEEADGSIFISGSVRLSKACLEHATVVNQVDDKFILIRVPVPGGTQSTGPGNTVLALVDQHAADERCRVEALFRSYHVGAEGVARTTLLEKPLQFELAADEGQLAARCRDVLRHWGVVYDVVASAPESSLLRVHRLPASLAERCCQEPQLVANLVRGEVWARSTATRPEPRKLSMGVLQTEAEALEPWVALFHGCPRGILHLLHSKACHSAIKFNDHLIHDECIDLINRLRKCAFPFQCAHGRPSMVPLLNLGPETPFSGGGWDEHGTE